MEEVVTEASHNFGFWIDVIKGFFYVIGLLVYWCVFLTLKVFNLKQGLALNMHSDEERGKSIEELKGMITKLGDKLEKLTEEIHSLELRKR